MKNKLPSLIESFQAGKNQGEHSGESNMYVDMKDE